jgi:hypothetical protein
LNNDDSAKVYHRPIARPPDFIILRTCAGSNPLVAQPYRPYNRADVKKKRAVL